MVLFDIAKNTSKTDTALLKYHSLYHEICNRYPTYHSVFTDGSKTDDKVTSAAVFTHTHKLLTRRLPANASVYSAELYAILLALQHIPKTRYHSHIVFSDSMSSLQAIASPGTVHPMVTDIILRYDSLCNNNHTIIFCWIPGHTGIKGNFEADSCKVCLHFTNYSHPTSSF